MPQLRFEPALEAEYLWARLSESRLLIRIACALGALLAIFRIAETLYQGTWSSVSLTALGFVSGSSVALAAVAWSSYYQRLYMPWARILIPTRNMVAAAQIATLASQGQLEMLMVLPIMLFAPFFFLGLRYRAALVCSVLTVAVYVFFTTLYALATPVVLRSYVFLLTGLIGFAVAAWHVERSARLGFLEGCLVAELAQHDSLTQTKNRRVFDEHLTSLWQLAIAHQRSICLFLIDIDHFKAYNDRYGHQAGDRALRHVAQAVRGFVRRPTDILARYGGEEFAVILYDADIGKARETAEQMRRAVADLSIEHLGSGECGRVTISLGVASVIPNLVRSPRGALQLADEALYEAKILGRNRVAVRDAAQHDLLVTGVFAADSIRPSA
jgi:diguanylate cyclase (GGDEF)-like protein